MNSILTVLIYFILQDILNIYIVIMIVPFATGKSNPTGTTFELTFVGFLTNESEFYWKSK